jgi:hypothetical protein
MRRLVVLAVCVLTLNAQSELAAQAAPRLEGAWQVTQVVTTGPNAATNNAPQPRMLVFSGRHYALLSVTSAGPRTQPADVAAATADELRAMWNPFTANAGTFEVQGERLTTRLQVAKNPNAMEPGASNEYTFRLAADTLWLTQVRNLGAAIANPATVRYVRAR